MNDKLSIKELIDKIKATEKGEKLDLSLGEDLSVAVMNLIAIEEHLFFSYGKTEDSKYVTLLSEIREIRKKLLKKLIKDYEGEEWCIQKHLLAGCMRLMEVGTKSMTLGNQKEAEEYFKMGYQLYEMFWGLNLKLIKAEDVKKTVPEEDSTHSFLGKLSEIIKKAVDCCKE